MKKGWLTLILIFALLGLEGHASNTSVATPDQEVTAIHAADNDSVAIGIIDTDADSNQMTVQSLFEYVVAPDDLPDLQSRTDYLMENFWNPFDFKKTKVVDQNALNHAFGVYAQAMQYATFKKVEDSVKKLIDKIKGNPGLTYQFTKAAEENLYGPRAEVWADDIYIMFLQNLVGNKKLQDAKKKKYAEQLTLLQSTKTGAPFPSLTVYDSSNSTILFKPEGEFKIIQLSSPNCPDCKYSNLKLDISSVMNDLIEDGRLEIDVLLLEENENIPTYPSGWKVFNAPKVSNILDIRMEPCFYVLDKDNKIIGKNLNVDDAIGLVEYLSDNASQKDK